MPTKAFQSFESARSPKNLEIPSNHTDVTEKRNIGRRRQAGAYIPPPSAAIARQSRTRCTAAGLARRPLRFTPEVNSGYLRSTFSFFPSDADSIFKKPLSSEE